ncbi:hypothetical protein ACFL3E_00925 [Patescibacteria group bacterium]
MNPDLKPPEPEKSELFDIVRQTVRGMGTLFLFAAIISFVFLILSLLFEGK